MTELILYIFGKGKSSPKVWRHKKQQRRHQSFIFVQAQNVGHSWIFLEESFPDKQTMPWAKVTPG